MLLHVLFRMLFLLRIVLLRLRRLMLFVVAVCVECGVIVVDARYEVRFPLVWILDGVMQFDDLVIQTTPVVRS